MLQTVSQAVGKGIRHPIGNGRPMETRTLIGMLTPSSNTVLEPLTSMMLAELYPEVSAHFGRFEVTEISLEEHALRQFEIAPILEAARLLAHARLDVICWTGTSASWLGFDRDHDLCTALTRETGVPAATSILAFNELLERQGAGRIGLVTPYTDDVQERILANYRHAGYECVAEEHFRDRGNFSFSEYDERVIEASVRRVAEARPDAIGILCTNLRGARIAARVEHELGVPVYDSVSAAVWKALRMTGRDTTPLAPWGRLFLLS